jgi:dihydrofolate synthase/folylpolyglutamate synthase
MDEMEQVAARIVALRDELTFSYFEAITAIAFLIFAARGVDYAVLETGLGGRFDATNAVEPVLSVITGISLDHRRILGDSEEEILREKMGITRRGVPLLVGGLKPGLQEIVMEKAFRDGFPVVAVEDLGSVRGNRAGPENAAVFLRTPSADYGRVKLPYPGEHQGGNALLAVGAAERVAGPLKQVPEALSHAYLPGRFETVEPHENWTADTRWASPATGNKKFILDVAHNDEALVAAIDQLSRHSSREENALVLGLMRRKELFEFPRRIGAAVGRVYVVSPDDGDAMAPAELAVKYLNSCFRNSGTDVMLCNKPAPAGLGYDYWMQLISHLIHPDNPCTRVLVTGSHHVVDQFGRRLYAPGEYE